MDKIIEIFLELETTKEHNGYFCSVADAMIIIILRIIYGLKNVSQIHQWAASEKIKKFLRKKEKTMKLKEFFNRKCKFDLLVFVFLAFSTRGGVTIKLFIFGEKEM